jgi:hypothetical protein
MLKKVRFGRTLAPILLSAFMLGAAFFAGISSGVAGAASHLYISLIAFTSVISSEVQGLKGHPYAGYDSVKAALEHSIYGIINPDNEDYARVFRDTKALNAALARASTVSTCGSGLVIHPMNDQGMIDFTRGAFWLFGIDVRSLYYFFFLLVGISILLFLVSHRRNYQACVLLFGCLCAIYGFMPSVVYEDSQLITIANSRFLSTLAIIPLFHILLILLRPAPRIRWPDLAAMVGQAALLAFAYFIRSTAVWTVATLVLVFALLVARPTMQALRRRSLIIPAQAAARCAIMMVFVATLFGISGVRSLYLTPPCGASLNAHLMWHNIFVGLKYSPDWNARFAAEYDRAEGDAIAFVAAKKFAQAHNLPYPTEPTIWINTPETLSMTIEPMPFGSWLVYEKILRSAFFEFARRHPGYVFENFLIHKPLRLLHSVAKILIQMWNDLTALQTAIAATMLILLAWLKAARSEAATISYPLVAAVLAVSFLMSAAPSIVAYSVGFLVSDQAYVAVAFTIFCCVWALGDVFALLDRRRLAPRKRHAVLSQTSP